MFFFIAKILSNYLNDYRKYIQIPCGRSYKKRVSLQSLK